MKCTVFSAMLRGPRTRQEDCLLAMGDLIQSDNLKQTKTMDADFLLAVVCDGLGGHDNGESASRFVCQQLEGRLNRDNFDRQRIDPALCEIQAAAEEELTENSGTTVAGLMVKNGRAIAFNAGDSRVYKITSSGMTYVSHDHSLVQGLVDNGLIQKEDANSHPLRNFVDFGIGPLFQGVWKVYNIHTFEDAFATDEAYLICSDGVHDLMNEAEMHEILMPDPADNGPALLAALEKKGLKDNTSFIILEMR
jgi:serine/threonine protein phosphatase PrpC